MVPLMIARSKHAVRSLKRISLPRNTQRDSSADVHKRIGTTLQIYGFVEHAQGSVYQALNTTALLCWFAVQYLKADTELASSIRSIQISYIHHVFHIHRMDCSDLLRLGGAHSPQLLGPTPRGLIPNNVQANPIADPSTLPLDYCKVTSASTDPDNWRT